MFTKTLLNCRNGRELFGDSLGSWRGIAILGFAVVACREQMTNTRGTIATDPVSTVERSNAAGDRNDSASPVPPQAVRVDPATLEASKNSYIVVFRAEAVGRGPGSRVPDIASDLVAKYGGVVTHQYEHALQGVAMKLAPNEREAVARDPRVAYIESDGVATVNQASPRADAGTPSGVPVTAAKITDTGDAASNQPGVGIQTEPVRRDAR